MEGELAKSTLFAGGEFSAADIQMSFVAEASAARGGLDKTRPKLMAWLERVHARPAYQRALARGGPFELMRQRQVRIRVGCRALKFAIH